MLHRPDQQKDLLARTKRGTTPRLGLDGFGVVHRNSTHALDQRMRGVDDSRMRLCHAPETNPAHRQSRGGARADSKEQNDRVSKLDFAKEQRELYRPGSEFELVDVPEMTFLAIDGAGDPNSVPAYAAAVAALYTASYAIKFHSKRELDRDYVVAPLEGLWWADDYKNFAQLDKSEWFWTMLIRQPDWIMTEELQGLVEATSLKKKSDTIADLRVETITEGLCVQVMHVGSYDDEAPTIARLHNEYIPQHGLAEIGRHHEIYLGDPRRSAPEKLRTVLRQPVVAGEK